MGPSFVTVAAQGFYRSRVRNCYPLPRRSKLCIACSDLFYKSERAHAAAPPFQLRPAIAELAVGVPPCGRHILFLTEISILTIPSQKKDMTYGHVFLFGGDKRDRTADLLNAIQALSPYKRVANPLKEGGESAFGTQKYLMTLDSQSPG